LSFDVHHRFICTRGKEIAMKKLSLLGRLYKSRRNRQNPKPFAGRRFSTLELLEDRRLLAAATFPGNFAPPDLVIPASVNQTVTAGQPLTVNLLTAGATISDLNSSGTATGDTIRYYLDPDVGTDTPTGATMTTAGVFTWTPTAAQVGTHRIVVIAVDSGTPALADAETFTVVVNAATPPAVVDLNGPDAGINTTATFTEGSSQPAPIVDQDATITDADDTNLESATITLTNRPDGEDESLAVTTTGTNIVATYNPTTGVLGLTGSDTVANYQLVIRTLQYNNVSPEPDTTARVVNVIVNDGTSNSAVATSTITITPVNDAPSVDLNGADAGTGFAATFTEDGAAVAIVGATSLVIGDVDSANLASATITITNLLDGTAELLEVVTTGTNITATYTAATGVLALTGSDTLASYQQVLRTLKYSNSSQNPNTTARSVTVVVNDGTSNSTPRTATVTVVGANDAPDLAAIANQNATVGILFELPVTATDPDGDTLTYQLDRTGVNTPASATITKDNNGQATIRWTPTAADTEPSYTFVVLVTDDENPALTDSQSFTVSIVTAPPSVDANGDGTGVDFAASFAEGDGPKAIVDTDLTVADFDSTTLASATVTITNLQNGADESLSVDTTGTAITAAYTAATGVLALTGSDTLASYQQVLRTLTYNNVSEDPGTTARAITIVANDGTANSAPATLTVSVAGVNDAVNLVLPVPYNSPTPVEVTQGSTVQFTATATDPDHTLAELTFHIDFENNPILIPGSAIQPAIVDGIFTWVADVVGEFDITILVTDGLGLPDQETFTIKVVAAP
jgi:hypothetical protein